MPRPLGISVTPARVAFAQSGLPGTPLNILMRQRRRTAHRYAATDHDAFGRLGLPLEAQVYLFVATLLDLADGTAPAAHAATNTGFWTGAVVDYAKHRDTAAMAGGTRPTA